MNEDYISRLNEAIEQYQGNGVIAPVLVAWRDAMANDDGSVESRLHIATVGTIAIAVIGGVFPLNKQVLEPFQEIHQAQLDRK